MRALKLLAPAVKSLAAQTGAEPRYLAPPETYPGPPFPYPLGQNSPTVYRLSTVRGFFLPTH